MAQVRGLLERRFKILRKGEGAVDRLGETIRGSDRDILKTKRTGKSEENLLGQHATKR